MSGSYSLSFRDVDDDGMVVMRHYRVRNMDNGGYYIAPTAHFKTLRELIEHHCGLYLPLVVCMITSLVGAFEFVF
jgi:hypothetical protein